WVLPLFAVFAYIGDAVWLTVVYDPESEEQQNYAGLTSTIFILFYYLQYDVKIDSERRKLWIPYQTILFLAIEAGDILYIVYYRYRERDLGLMIVFIIYTVIDAGFVICVGYLKYKRKLHVKMEITKEAFFHLMSRLEVLLIVLIPLYANYDVISTNSIAFFILNVVMTKNAMGNEYSALLNAALGNALGIFISPALVFYFMSNPIVNSLPDSSSSVALQEQTIRHPLGKQTACVDQRKVTRVFTSMESLVEVFKQHVSLANYNLIPISVLPTISLQHLNDIDWSFTFTYLLKELLLTMDNSKAEKKEFVNLCRKYFKANPLGLNIIDEFQKTYQQTSAIQWYTREDFIYSVWNKALRIENMQIIMHMVFFAQDLYRQIVQIHTDMKRQNSISVFHGQGLSKTMFNKLQQNKTGLMSFNTFLVTHASGQDAIDWARRSYDHGSDFGIVFQMEVDTSTPIIPLNGTDYKSDSNSKFLLPLHSTFRIREIKSIGEQLWQINLTSINTNDQSFARFIHFIDQEVCGSTALSRLGNFHLKMGKINEAIELYLIMLEITSDRENQLLAHIHHQLGYLYNEICNLTKARIHYEKSIQLYLTYLPANDPSLSNSYSNLAVVLKRQGDLVGAMKYHQHGLSIDLKAPQPDYEQIATRYNNIGVVLRDQNKYSEALDYYQRALKIELEHLPPTQPILATTYNNIADIHRLQENFATALEFYQKTLAIEQIIFSMKHPSLAITYFNIAVTLDGMNRLNEAIEHASKALEINQHIFGSDHEETIENQALLDMLRSKRSGNSS
ncbi:unnamed protein product, partial [Rotaria sordida]